MCVCVGTEASAWKLIIVGFAARNNHRRRSVHVIDGCHCKLWSYLLISLQLGLHLGRIGPLRCLSAPRGPQAHERPAKPWRSCWAGRLRRSQLQRRAAGRCVSSNPTPFSGLRGTTPVNHRLTSPIAPATGAVPLLWQTRPNTPNFCPSDIYFNRFFSSFLFFLGEISTLRDPNSEYALHVTHRGAVLERAPEYGKKIMSTRHLKPASVRLGMQICNFWGESGFIKVSLCTSSSNLYSFKVNGNI